MSPFEWFDQKVMDPMVQRALRDQERIVRTGSYPAWKLVVLLAVAVAALLVMIRWPHAGLTWLAAAFIGGMLAQAAMGGLRRAQAYRNGWIAGRRDYDDQLGRWLDRDETTAGDFRMAQLLRTYAVLGSDPAGLPNDTDDNEC